MALSFRRLSAVLLATALLATAPFEAVMAQGGPTVGAPGGVSQTSPSNSDGFRAGGTGVIGTTRVSPDGTRVRPARQAARRRHQARRANTRQRQRAIAPAAAPAPGDASPAAPMPTTTPR